ncbi:MAG TPA: O-antigen polymerase [Salinimicrobium sp.]|nr:O-antigen polymerase [Salinimicrobium sp.]
MEFEFYDFFCIVIILMTLRHIYKNRKTLFCLSNVVLIIFNLIFVIAPSVIGNNPITKNIDLLLPLLLGFVIMFFVFQKKHPIKQKIKVIKNIKNKSYIKILNFIIFIFICKILYLIVTGQFENILTINRSEDRLENYYVESFDFLSILDMVFKNVFFIVAAVCGEKKIGYKKIILGFILMAIEAVAVSKHRTPVITPIILGVIFFHLYIKKLKAHSFLILAVGVIFFMAISSYIRIGDISQAEGKTFEQRMAHGLSGLNTSGTFNVLHQKINHGFLEYEYGYQFFLNIVTLVPRVIWEDKPNVSFSSRMTEDIYGKIDVGNWVRTYTVWGEGYTQFGFLGILLYSFILAYGLKKFIYFLSGYSGMEIILINFMIYLPFLIRADLFAVYTRVLVILIAILMIKLFFGFYSIKRQLSIYNILIK